MYCIVINNLYRAVSDIYSDVLHAQQGAKAVSEYTQCPMTSFGCQAKSFLNYFIIIAYLLSLTILCYRNDSLSESSLNCKEGTNRPMPS